MTCPNHNNDKCSITGYQCLLSAPCLNLCVALFGKVTAGEEKDGD
jgi:hypothetical protein